jgi:hypothetical protein
MPNDPLAAVRQLKIGMRAQEGRELGLHRLLDQPPRAKAEDFSERVVDFVFLTQGDNFILGHGVTLLREVRIGWIPTPLRRLPRAFHHPLSRIARSQASRSTTHAVRI